MGGEQSTIRYCVPVSEAQPGETPIMRNPRYPNKLNDLLPGNIGTIQGAIEDALKRLENKPFIGKRDPKTQEFVYRTYGEEYSEARRVGTGIVSKKLVTDPKEYQGRSLQLIGVYSKNRIEWNTLDMACALYGITLIPFYDTLGVDTISYILNQTEITSCVCSAASIKTILTIQDIHSLRTIISFDEIDEETVTKLTEKGIQLIAYNEVKNINQDQILPLPTNIKPETVFTFSYTSGTTGMPKGAMLTHRNIISVIANLESIDLQETDCQLCYLPLPHVMQRLLNVCCWYKGTKMAFFGGDVLKLKEDIQAVKPTIFLSVPRIFNRFYDAINLNLKQLKGFKATLFQQALKTKLQNLKEKGDLSHMIYDKLVFQKIKDIFGGRVRLMATGSAPISSQVLDFYKVVMGCPFVEVYGQTEGTGLGFETLQKDMHAVGTVGGIKSNLEMKLIDVPEMNYFSTDKNELGELVPRGEICVRGPGVFAGYYKDVEKTKEAIDDQGFLHSGDIGCLLPNGALKIIDRRKNIFKLSQGEYVAPEKIENIYVRARGVQEVFVYGDPLKGNCVGIIVPDHEELKKIAMELGIHDNLKTIEEHCQDEGIIQCYQKNILAHGKANKLFGFEQAMKIHLEPTSFVHLGLCTSTMKLQRFQAKKHYADVLNKLYSSFEN